jgi:hypothetical protein
MMSKTQTSNTTIMTHIIWSNEIIPPRRKTICSDDIFSCHDTKIGGIFTECKILNRVRIVLNNIVILNLSWNLTIHRVHT